MSAREALELSEELYHIERLLSALASHPGAHPLPGAEELERAATRRAQELSEALGVGDARSFDEPPF